MAGQKISMKKLFLLILFLKISSSLLGWWFDSPWLLGFAVPMVVMVLYIAAGSVYRDKDELSDEKFADSCYYLGFIFTISSIIVCLFDLPNIAGQLTEIAIRFGAAMVSTVLGLTARVYLVNFRKDVYDITRSVEDDLLMAAKKLRTQLEMATDGLRIFNDTVDDATATALGKVNLAMEETAARFMTQCDELFEHLAVDHRFVVSVALEQTDAATQTLAALLQQHTTAVDEHGRQLRDSLLTFTDELHQRLARMRMPDDYFSAALTPPVEQLAAAVTRLSGQVEAAAERLQEGTLTMTEATATASTRLKQVLVAEQMGR